MQITGCGGNGVASPSAEQLSNPSYLSQISVAEITHQAAYLFRINLVLRQNLLNVLSKGNSSLSGEHES